MFNFCHSLAAAVDTINASDTSCNLIQREEMPALAWAHSLYLFTRLNNDFHAGVTSTIMHRQQYYRLRNAWMVDCTPYGILTALLQTIVITMLCLAHINFFLQCKICECEIHFAITMAYASSTQFVSQQLVTHRRNTSTLTHRRRNSLEQGGAGMCTIATLSSNYMYKKERKMIFKS